MTYNGQHPNCDYPYLCSRFELLIAITLSFQTEFVFSFSMIIIKNVRNDGNHFSNQKFVLFQNKFFQSRYEVSVILPAFSIGRVDLWIVADDGSKISKPVATQSLIV